MKKQQGFGVVEIIVILVATLLVAGLAYTFFTRQNAGEPALADNTAHPVAPEQKTKTTAQIPEGWQEYTDPKFGFVIAHPEEFIPQASSTEIGDGLANRKEGYNLFFGKTGQGNGYDTLLDIDIFYQTLDQYRQTLDQNPNKHSIIKDETTALAGRQAQRIDVKFESCSEAKQWCDSSVSERLIVVEGEQLYELTTDPSRSLDDPSVKIMLSSLKLK